ncbi:hlh transcription factor [Grosmannia clavigera kw1407]|uniref:Hlh transcription factor n=1 Tax=Grosmannia clavigera (strain kw1407 / UAMH 11150) TaxID=655863 RepID=F0XRP9_GROCL|nr:hlh transcription factor [Grosmannia clavigera kw1407]EFW99645.1 hlh transcription factor [Grosmannia clavigera kw1407]
MDAQIAQKLPAGLAGVLNSPDLNRDSAYFSSADPSSKHTSAASCAGVSIAGPPSASSVSSSNVFRSPSSQPDKTPSPTSAANLLPQPLASPSTSSMSVASMVSPTTSGPSDLRRLADRPHSYEAIPNGMAFAASDYDPMARRESVDSRINQGFGDLRLSGNSPYASHNHSTTSVHNTLQQQQRQQRSGLDNLSIHRISNGYQPNAERNPDGHNKIVRTAPAITGPAISQIARAAEPTKGQAWAFPEEEIHRMPSTLNQSLDDSRRSSIADSLASSQFTSESRLPSGQRRFDEPSPDSTGTAGAMDYHDQRMSNEYPTTHHHALQHRRLEDLQAEGDSPLSGSQPYSRTPELRISHKLAERKRRTEMKELFEQLRDLMPQERGSKASKWEILTKAITEHQRLQETIRSAQQHSAALSSDVSILKNEVHALRMENQQLRADVANMHQGNGSVMGPGPGQQQSSVMNDPFSRSQQAPRPELPPLRSLGSGIPQSAPPESMTGVQYEQARVGGFRPSDRY